MARLMFILNALVAAGGGLVCASLSFGLQPAFSLAVLFFIGPSIVYGGLCALLFFLIRRGRRVVLISVLFWALSAYAATLAWPMLHLVILAHIFINALGMALVYVGILLKDEG